MEKIIEYIQNLDGQVIVELLYALGVILIFRILSSLISRIIILIFKPKNRDIIRNVFYLPLRTILTFVGIYIALDMVQDTLQITPEILAIITKVLKILMIMFVAKAFGDSLDEKNGIFSKFKTKSNEMDKSTKNILFKTIKIAIYVFAGFMIISELGYDIGGFITGLGIGGVVITLAAQDTAKNLIGGVAIFVDKPFKEGDYIKVGTYEGTVEEIKFRSTSIRTLDNSVLHIPNSEMSISAIVNYNEMEKRRYHNILTLELDTSLEKVESVKCQIENTLLKREDIISDSIIVKFNTISNNGFDVLVMAYMNETRYAEYLKIKEQINYEIMTILQNENVQLAYNTQTIYIKK